eukprot:COSAG05_NODE_63_length_22889_cov_41.986617_15_plen_202_part_00
MASTADVDYESAGRELLAQLNLGDADGGGGSANNHLDAIWADPTTGARVFIGNQTAARSESLLKARGITYIVNCQDLTAPNFHEKNPDFSYCRFPVAHWFKHATETPQEVLAYYRPVHSFIEQALAAGNGVLIHCLAGAHRAGTTGVSWLMHVANMDQAAATAAAKAQRQVVNPFGHLLEILAKLESAHAATRGQSAAAAK